MNGCVVAEKTLDCYKGDDKPRTNKQKLPYSIVCFRTVKHLKHCFIHVLDSLRVYKLKYVFFVAAILNKRRLIVSVS